MIAYLKLGSSCRRSGQKPALPATQVKPGVADKNGPGTNVVVPTTDPADGFGTVLGVTLSPGSDPAATRPVRHICVAITVLRTESDVLSRHPVERERSIPSVVRIARVLREIRRASNRISSIDRRQQGQIAPWIGHGAAAKGDAIQIFLEPPAVVEHPTGECLLAARWPCCGGNLRCC